MKPTATKSFSCRISGEAIRMKAGEAFTGNPKAERRLRALGLLEDKKPNRQGKDDE